jgi:nucleotide-binding universal stress UspA family protein
MSNRPLVLVAIDHATDMERTIRAALSTAEARGADVQAIRVVPHRALHGDARDLMSVGSVSAHGAELAVRLASARKFTTRDGAPVRLVTLRGMPERVIPAYAQVNPVIALVVEPDYGSARFWRNSRVVDELARQLPVPLLVLPKGTTRNRDQGGLRRIIAPIDFSIASAVALRTAVAIARRHGARLTLVHALRDVSGDMVFSGSEAWETIRHLPAQEDAVAKRLKRRANFFGANDVETAVLTGVADRAILDTAAHSQADLVVMGIPQRSWLNRIAFGSTLRGVLRRATTPVLAVPVTAGSYPWPVVEDDGPRAGAASAIDRVAA